MLKLDQLIPEIDVSVGRRSEQDRVRTLGKLTDLFAHGAQAFTATQVEVFDVVMQRFATAIETRARVELAERLVEIAKAPPGLVRDLAHDEILVARTLLARSSALDDQALMSVAIEKGRDHMLAICERPAISAAVTDVLVQRGDGVVRHAVVGNPGARFSGVGVATLINHARADEALGALLSERNDLPPAAVHQLLDMAKETARARLLSALPGADREVASAIERGALSLATETSPVPDAKPSSVLASLMDGRVLQESDLARVAAKGSVADAVGVMASMTGLSIACLERIFDERDNDLMIVIGKAKGWSWGTVLALMRRRDPNFTQRHQIRRAEDTYDGLATATAGRVVHFLKVRESSGGPKASSERRFA